MKDYLIVKISRPSFSDASVAETRNGAYNGACNRLKKFAKARGEEFKITVSEGIAYFDGNAIIEVYYTKDLSADDKKMIVDELSCFLLDRPFMQSNAKLYQLPATVFFRKFDAEDVIEVSDKQ